MDKKPLLLYLDVPFCPVRCDHCAKPAMAPRAEWREAYMEALHREVRAQRDSLPDYEIRAVWVGGGIPGHMADGPLGELLRELPRLLPMAPDAEITLKVHPGMVSVDTLDLCRHGHVTRLSVEYVTGNSFEHENLGRFLAPDAMDTTRMVLGSSRLDLSFDILTGVPGQNEATLLSSLGAAVGYGAGHISLYPLRLLPETTLCRRWEREGERLQQNQRRRLPDETEQVALSQSAGEYLAAHGFREYLPGRWALPGKECRYFRLEREGTEVLGCGLGAVTVLEGLRSENTADLSTYLRCSTRPDKIICRVEPV